MKFLKLLIFSDGFKILGNKFNFNKSKYLKIAFHCCKWKLLVMREKKVKKI